MQLSQVSTKVNKKEKSINNALYIMGAVLVVFVALFLVYGVDPNTTSIAPIIYKALFIFFSFLFTFLLT